MALFLYFYINILVKLIDAPGSLIYVAVQVGTNIHRVQTPMRLISCCLPDALLFVGFEGRINFF